MVANGDSAVIVPFSHIGLMESSLDLRVQFGKTPCYPAGMRFIGPYLDRSTMSYRIRWQAWKNGREVWRSKNFSGPEGGKKAYAWLAEKQTILAPLARPTQMDAELRAAFDLIEELGGFATTDEEG